MAVVICGADGPIFTMHAADARAARSAEMLAHAAMDAVESESKGTTKLWLGAVERLSEFFVSARRTAGTTILVVLQERKDAETAAFCSQAHELLVKASLNPLQRPGTPIWSKRFRIAMQRLARVRLGVDLE